MSIGVYYPDNYAVEEVFQLLKVPWEWYEPDRHYDVVITSGSDVPGWSGNLIDLADNNLFGKVSDLLNKGELHLHEPSCDILIDSLRQELKKYTILVEVPPAPWGHPYMVALTHDVDVTSVRECRLATVAYAAFQCIIHGAVADGFQFVLSLLGMGRDPWALFERWKTFEDQLGVRSTFFFVPKKDVPGLRGHPYRAVGYDVGEKTVLLNDLSQGGWEIGVHGIDNWLDAGRGKEEQAFYGNGRTNPGNRTHWLLFDRTSWRNLEEAGYSYDTTIGYNDDAGFRAGTMQVYRPHGVQNLLELPLHIQDLGLLGKSCRAPAENGWTTAPCLHLGEDAARTACYLILDYARRYGGAVTILWHCENLTPPRDWSGIYADIVKRALADSAWVTTAGNVVAWFEERRKTRIEYVRNNKVLTIRVLSDVRSGIPARVRLHINPASVSSVDGEHVRGNSFIDIRCDRPEITVVLT